jgi:hypothetical protein
MHGFFCATGGDAVVAQLLAEFKEVKDKLGRWQQGHLQDLDVQ